MKRRLERQSSLYYLKHRVAGFGLLLCAADIMSRRLPMKPLERIVRSRMNAIEDLHIK